MARKKPNVNVTAEKIAEIIGKHLSTLPPGDAKAKLAAFHLYAARFTSGKRP
jgi:hypothetical protein